MNLRGFVFFFFDSWAIWIPPDFGIEAEIWIRRRTLSSYDICEPSLEKLRSNLGDDQTTLARSCLIQHHVSRVSLVPPS